MLPDPGSWAWLGLGSALDGISGVTREGTLSDKPHVVCGPQKKRAPRLSLATFLVSAHGDRSGVTVNLENCSGRNCGCRRVGESGELVPTPQA